MGEWIFYDRWHNHEEIEQNILWYMVYEVRVCLLEAGIKGRDK